MTNGSARRAYATVLSHGDLYQPGIEVLGQSLKATGTPHPMVLLATPDVPAACTSALSRQGWIVRPVEPIKNPVPETQMLYPRFATVFTKLRAWQLTDYDKIVLLDADTLVLANIDELFARPAPAAAPDFFVPEQFNSGVMVIEPSEETFAAMMRALAETPSYDGGDQGFLNRFFGDWYAMPIDHRLPSGFNTHHFILEFLERHESLRKQLSDHVKIVHYTLQKPWLSKAMLSGGAEHWWSAYFAAHPEQDRPWKRRLHAMEDGMFARVVRLLGA